MRWLNLLNVIAWIANFVGVTCGLYLLLIGIDRNTQGEFIDEARALDYVYAVKTFIAGFLAGAIATAIVLSTIVLSIALVFAVLARWLFRRSS